LGAFWLGSRPLLRDLQLSLLQAAQQDCLLVLEWENETTQEIVLYICRTGGNIYLLKLPHPSCYNNGYLADLLFWDCSLHFIDKYNPEYIHLVLCHNVWE